MLVGGSHDHAIALLNEFADKQGEKLIDDPLKRAALQLDLALSTRSMWPLAGRAIAAMSGASTARSGKIAAAPPAQAAYLTSSTTP